MFARNFSSYDSLVRVKVVQAYDHVLPREAAEGKELMNYKKIQELMESPEKS